MDQCCGEGGAVVNPTKARITWFSLNNYIVKDSTPIVKLCSGVVERTYAMKHIEVSFNRSLTFAVHKDQVVMKVRKGPSAMKVTMQQNVNNCILSCIEISAGFSHHTKHNNV
jgi:hypothetical protein